MNYSYLLMPSPVGQLKLVARDERLAAILWENDKPNRVRLGDMTLDPEKPVLMRTARQLAEYFAGTRHHFELELDFNGTEFQRKVWQALLTIPFGETRTYSEIALQIGSTLKAVRAVGAANGKNPISIIAPCHRVIGASGELTGFAGGLEAKALLLELEGCQWANARKHPPGTAGKHRDKAPNPNLELPF
ncbi:methylated-DNA--[protein]-cysteine S-methyltransferase [Pseudomonas gingeri]|uniref:Methylated-DNA--protein-cysteine methyltransferase n=1 Tax=Pseudomonas gingeri TaxID=117681 RepID=A0A7Y7YCI1_9PSED|nr:methylated-DNA--[protein]-cysteine S-methyltransferase [Pseudomonas gingeri]NWA01052.1 methylated-DNA--[protein]-cysteine S-methyltransferase [Pseudomonas gingeri]NWA14037.1 methylated-DNA--[protein]-cysteine S-methyltransferase [Pseudomonas gingeri]NWA56577.1 methylated-DNA--[protein]-cysteine S-methyltransferase [Pseudomonas gingeri]NWA95071.1 methylated-DNA--[protein]-cysteine S-methyltransferase [Pseudomonas gingeri]NWB05153.1 methylated-DNA--[protein]-cysteine S-methyltransferase [Pseu